MLAAAFIKLQRKSPTRYGKASKGEIRSAVIGEYL
jgi:hypothetical protein